MKKLVIILSCASLFLCSWFIQSSTADAKEPRKATILYFNDAHEISPVVNEYGDRGGVARLKTVIDRVKEDNKHTAVAFGGDLGGGTLFGGVYKGFPIVEVFNQIGIDIANFGQHDFDFGSEVTEELVEASKFQWITSNLTDPEGNSFANLPTYQIINQRGIKIGIIGLTDDMYTTTNDGKVIQQDIIPSAKKAVEQIKRKEKVDVIIALTQESLEKDKQLLDAVPEIDAVFTEEKAEDRSFIIEHGNDYILAPEGNIGSVIRLDITKHAKDINLVPTVIEVDHTVPENPELKALADYYQNKLEEDLGQTIAQVETSLDYGDNHESRYEETNIGNFVADSYRDHFYADIGLMNGGGIRTSIPAGEFTLRDAYAILPFGNKVILANVKGETIQAALENSVSRVESLGGGFLQVSGIHYSYNANHPVGERVQSVTINNEPIDLEKDYLVAMPNYIFHGGDGYTMFAESEILVDDTNAQTDAEVLIQYASKLGTINASLEGRIVVIQ
ncbi:bifunctional metallophosphatase/5'-nucleotidase [Oceanobacillus damuensis]|uniref:bifunctional metallophosphatase/5'-nucleotidase n=1 Tax=Oceanobacillus damuensis TaxID=937928 RepID=UPI0008303FF9|nr:bifunctional UDP-sugar hydrolase/5'-nucleotidase [Oceanobacillus damuensis]